MVSGDPPQRECGQSSHLRSIQQVEYFEQIHQKIDLRSSPAASFSAVGRDQSDVADASRKAPTATLCQHLGSSRRETNREMTRPQFVANLHLLFPEIEALPHADTLYRLLRDIDLGHLEQGARRPGTPPVSQQELPAPSDQPLPSDHHRWLAEARRRHPLGGRTPAAQRRQGRNPPHPVLRLRARGQPCLPRL